MKNSIELELTHMAHGGEAVGRYEGKAIFVPLAIPGEVARVEIIQDKGRYARARLMDIVRPSPDRVEPACPHAPPAGRCGGCHWQHIAYPAQRRFKADIVRDALQRLGGLPDPPAPEVAVSPQVWMYRNHVEFSTTRHGQLGFFDMDGRQVTPISECHILDAALADLFEALDFELPGLVRLGLRKGSAEDDVMLIFETEDDEPPDLETDMPLSVCLLMQTGEAITLVGNPYLTYEVAGAALKVSPATFFQVNTAQAGALVDVVTGMLDVQAGESVLDAYCGAGLFSAALSRRARQVVGIEASPSACADFRRNFAGLDHVRLVEGQVGDALPGLSEHFDAVVLDPPRGGCEPGALDALLAVRPPRLVFVGCDPATLARDLKRLTQAGYRVDRIRALDMFPHTYHIETCVKCVLA